MNGYDEIVVQMGKARKQFHNALDNVLKVLDKLHGEEHDALVQAYFKALDGIVEVGNFVDDYVDRHADKLGLDD